MASRAGIAFIELFDLVDRTSSALPAEIETFLERFVVVGYSNTTSAAAVFHRGLLQRNTENTSVDSSEASFDISIGRLSLPLLHAGIPFQLILTRATTASNLEPRTGNWQLDLSLDVFTLTLNGLQPAIYVPESGTFPQHLLRDTERSEVYITGKAVLRISSTVIAAAAPQITVALIDQLDPLAPGTPSGTVSTITVSPPHFFIGGSEFGLTVGRVQFDFSDSYSPPNVLEARQGPEWMGVLINEATLYAPRNLPTLGDISGGVKNLLLGSPTGLQGELEIQFGRTLLAANAFLFEQNTSAGNVPLSIVAERSDTATIKFSGAAGDEQLIHGALQSSQADPNNLEDVPNDALLRDWTAVWHWPNGSSEEADFSSGTVRPGQSLRVTPIEFLQLQGESEVTRFEHPEIVYRFVIDSDSPQIDAMLGSESFNNVVNISGSSTALADIELSALDSRTDATLHWQLSGDNERYSGETLRIGDTAYRNLRGKQLLTLTDSLAGSPDRLTRLQIQILEEGEVLIGCEQGVFDASDSASALSLSAVEQTFDLSDFHLDGMFNSARESATLDLNAQLQMPEDALAQVTISDNTTPVIALDRHVQILMDFDTDNELRWGDHRPAGTPEAFSQSDLLAWANRYTDVNNTTPSEFLVIGRCGDIGEASYNTTLATDRAARAVALLTQLNPGQTGTPIDIARIAQRGEQSPFSASVRAVGGDLEDDDNIALDDAEQETAVGNDTFFNGWLIKAENAPEFNDWPPQRDPTHPSEATRERYRRVDIYAVTGMPSDASARPDDTATVGSQLRRSLVPSGTREPQPLTPASPAVDYRVRLHFIWDSPSVTELKDAIPTLAEAEYVWTPQDAELPPINNEDVPLNQSVLTLFANWNHDARTGYTKITLGIRSDGNAEGLVATDSKTLSAALAFGPALLSGVTADQQIGSAGRIAAFATAVSFADTFLTDDTSATLLEAAFETEMRSISAPGPDLQTRVLTSYTASMGVDAGVFGLRTTPGYPLKVRYNNVGIEFDTSEEDFWERFGLVYDTNTLEIVDPGRWEINGVLGSLLRIIEVTVGRGSIWFEGRIAVALEIGIFEVTEAAIRLTFDGSNPIPAFELRGLVIRCNVPGVLEGEGSLRIESELLTTDDGETIENAVIRAAIDASVVPLGLGVTAGLGMARIPPENTDLFLELFLGVQFATPLPLAQSGMAIYGFTGLFAMNGRRAVNETETDPVVRELDWWGLEAGNKYQSEPGQYALGVGVVVGTFPDTSFCLSCSGMVVVAFPDPEVILGVEINIIEAPDTIVKDTNSSDAVETAAAITGLIIIDDEAVTLAASANYTIPSVLEVKVPFAAYFPYPGSGRDVYVRIGSDGEAGRSGEPVSLTLLPGTLDARAWTYLMIEQGGLQRLGGDDRFNFDGFAVGFGAGWEINWSAAVIKLHASAKVLLGFGTAPLLVKGGVFVDGELDMVAVSISTHGELIAEIRDNRQSTIPNDTDMFVRLDGEFCGEVDLLFFSLSGCVGISIGSPTDQTPPPPPSPVRGISLVDRRDRIMGTGTTSENPRGVPIFGDTGNADDNTSAATINDNHTVWPDTTPVIHFTHYVENDFASAQFSPGPTPSQEPWWGSAGLKYAYQVSKVELRYVDTPDSGVFDSSRSVWTTSPYRQPDSSGVSSPIPSEHEGPNLKLLDWNPWAWVVNMTDGADSQAGDPVQTIEDLCEPLPIPKLACVFGRDARNKGEHRVRLRQRAPAPGPYPSRFHVSGEPVVELGDRFYRGRALQTLAQAGGGFIETGRIVALPYRVTIDETELARGYALPVSLTTDKSGVHRTSLPWWGSFDRPLVRPAVVLMLCDDEGSKLPDGFEEICEDFRNVRPGRDVKSFEHNGIVMSPVAAGELLRLEDKVDQRGRTPVRGFDGSAEISIPEVGGLDIELGVGCVQVTVGILPSDLALNADALSANDKVLDEDSIDSGFSQPVVMKFTSHADNPIVRIRISGGNGEAVVFKVCCVRVDDGDSPVPDDATPARVSGLIGERVVDAWRARLLEQHTNSRQRCRLIEFTPADARVGPWDGFKILADNDLRVTLVSVCGVDQDAIDKRTIDEQVRATLIDNLESVVSSEPDERRELLLEPGTELELEIEWKYQAFRADDPDQRPPATSSGTWVDGGVELFRFAIAADETGPATPQDGLNEYRFDARDIERYLIGVEPADGRAVHFTDDPIWAHFEAGHVEQLLELYERKLLIEVRRTDPPPKPDVDQFLAALDPITITADWTALSGSLQAPGNQRLNTAVQTSLCLTQGTPFDGASLAVNAILAPQADYDLRILAPLSDVANNSTSETDPVVLATRFETSRYANPRELLDALGFPEATVGPYLPDDLFVPDGASVPTGDLVVSDTALYEALSMLDADTLPLPTQRARTYLFWQADATGDWLIHAMLIDSLEPLLRERTVIEAGDTVPQVGIRCSVGRAEIAGNHFNAIHTNTRWTRVLFVPNEPVGLIAGIDHTFVLRLNSSDGLLSGTRRVRSVPSILEREAL